MTRRPRYSQFGTVIARHDKYGRITAWQARYVNPKDHSKKVQRNFKPGQETLAYQWLDQEHLRVDHDALGLEPWVHPSQRNTTNPYKSVDFATFARTWVEEYRLPTGQLAQGATKRNLKADVEHLIAAFGNLQIHEITSEIIHTWYDQPHAQGPHSWRRQCLRLKSLLNSAKSGTCGSWGKLIDASPFDLPMPPHPQSDRTTVQPITKSELHTLYYAMPDYDRLSIYLAALAGGLRIGEVCALQKDDIDFNTETLYIHHSINRGPTDTGPLQLCPTKTRGSRRIVPLPHKLIGYIRDHIATFCHTSNPQLFPGKRTDILAPTTLQSHFRAARQAAGREDITFHTLRASHATLLMIEGGTLKEAMDDLGHVSEKVALDHYQRIVPEHRRAINEKLADLLL